MARRFALHCEAWSEDGFWFAQCLEISIGVQGESLEDVKEQLGVALKEYIEDMLEMMQTGEKVSIIPPVRKFPLRMVKWHIRNAWGRVKHIGAQWLIKDSGNLDRLLANAT